MIKASKILIWVGMIIQFYLIYPIFVGWFALKKIDEAASRDDLQTMGIITAVFCSALGGVLMLCIKDEELNEKKSFGSPIIQKCKELITTYESPLLAGEQSCLNNAIKKIKVSLGESSQPMENIEEKAHFLICVTCFNMLSSGEYHIIYGSLNPFTSSAIMKVYKKSAEWLLNNGCFTQEEFDTHNKDLRNNIATVG